MRLRTTLGVRAPPLKRIASGRAGFESSVIAPAADWRGLMPAEECGQMSRERRHRPRRAGRTPASPASTIVRAPRPGSPGGRSPPQAISRTSARVSSDWRLPPMSREPRPAIVTGHRSRGGSSREELLLGGPAGEPQGTPLLGVEPRRRRASARRGGPGRGRCCRRRASGGRRPPRVGSRGRSGVSTTVIRLKSVVPPPMSQTRISSPARTCCCQPLLVRDDPAIERRLRLFQQRDLSPGRPASPPRWSARAPPRQTMPGR